MRRLRILWFLILVLGQAAAQSIQIEGSQLALPTGNVIGAAFDNDLLIMQQAVLSAEGGRISSKRRILSTDLRGKSIVKTSVLPGDGSSLVGDHCGKVAVDAPLSRVFVCSNESSIAVLDAETLQLVNLLDCERIIEDFTVDEGRHRLFVFSQEPGHQYLTIYDSANGKRLEDVNVSEGVIDSAQVTLSPYTHRLALAESVLKHSGYTTDLYGCMYNDHLLCQRVAQTGQVSQVALAGNELLMASGLLDDDPNVCLTQVDLVTKSISRPYCAPGGVHYGVGVLDGRYIVAYTGTSKRLHFKEETIPLESSVSVWNLEASRVIARAVQQGQQSAFQGAARIASNQDGSRFALFSVTSNTAYVYSVREVR